MFGITGENHPSRGKIYITDGTSEKLILPTDEMPDGWARGRKQI